jgi:hypothetical protein
LQLCEESTIFAADKITSAIADIPAPYHILCGWQRPAPSTFSVVTQHFCCSLLAFQLLFVPLHPNNGNLATEAA